MGISLNHTIVHARDPEATARYLADMLQLPPPSRLGHFIVLQVGETSLDFIQTSGEIASRHFAFLASEDEFDQIFNRILESSIPYWADPFHTEPNQINHWDDGRGVYFDDPNGHLIEIITRPYGSGGLHAKHPNPLLAR